MTNLNQFAIKIHNLRQVYGVSGCVPSGYEVTLNCSSLRIHRHALWILGEYCENESDLLSVMDVIKTSLGEVCVLK